MNCRAFNPTDLYQIDLQPRQQNFHAWAPINYACALAAQGRCYTLVENATIFACLGIIDIDSQAGLLWSFLARHAAARLLKVMRVAERFMDCSGKRRVFSTCEVDFAQGLRCLDLMGFERVKVLEKYGPDGSDHVLFCRSIH